MVDQAAWMDRDAERNVPRRVLVALHDAGYRPSCRAGGLWLFARDNVVLLFGDDGSDYPESLDDPVTVSLADAEDDGGDPEAVDVPTLRLALAITISNQVVPLARFPRLQAVGG